MNDETPVISRSAVKIPRWIKFQRFMDDNRRWLFGLTILLALCLAGYSLWISGLWNSTQQQPNQPSFITDLFNNATFAGILGAFIGAVGSGVFSFSLLRNQFAASAATSKKNVIYVPLFNELKDIRSQHKDDRYAWNVRVNGGFFPDKSTWEEMKQDNRYLEIPAYIISILDELNLKFITFKKQKENASIEATNSVNEILRENSVQ